MTKHKEALEALRWLNQYEIKTHTGKSAHDCIEQALQAASWQPAECRETYQSYHRIMTLLRNLEMQHGKCHPREDRACTHCNAEDDIKKLVSEYKGAPVYASSPAAPVDGGETTAIPREDKG